MDITLEELLEAGAHFGHQVKRWDPRMAPYIYAVNDGVHIFDLAKTREALLEAYKVVRDRVSKGDVILLVGTKRQAKDLMTATALKTGMPYMTTRWLGGALTNFEQIRKSIRKLEDMKAAKEHGEYESYTKKEKLLIDREIVSLERVLGGVASLKKLPDMLFVLDTHEEATAVREANKVNIPIVGVTDTNADPDRIEFPIPANDDAIKSITLIINFMGKAIEDGLAEKHRLVQAASGLKPLEEEKPKSKKKASKSVEKEEKANDKLKVEES